MGERKLIDFTKARLAWQTQFDSELVRVELATAWLADSQAVTPETPRAYEVEVWRVTPSLNSPNKPRTFYGESAWSDAQRYAGDIDFQALLELN